MARVDLNFLLKSGTAISALLLVLILQRNYLSNLVWSVDSLASDNQIDCPESDELIRTFDGSCNNLDNPEMGAVTTRFNRLGNESNIMSSLDSDDTNDTLLSPNPRTLAQEFLWFKDGKQKRIDNLSLLIGPWMQFVSNDLFFHDNQLDPAETIDIEIFKGDPLWNKTTAKRSDKLVKDGGSAIKQYYSVLKTKIDETFGDKPGDDSRPETFQNQVSAWLDASPIYGSDESTADSLRDPNDDAKLAIDSKDKDDTETDEYILPLFDNGTVATGFNKNMWLGLEMIHKLFVLEHNAFVDNYRRHLGNESDISDEELYQTARLVISALIAKIHITEFATAVGGDDFQKVFDDTIWYNIELPWFQRVNYPDRNVDTTDSDEMKAFAIMYEYFTKHTIKAGNGTSLNAVTYQTVEALVASSRMHSLLPSKINMKCTPDIDGKKYGKRTIKPCKERKYNLEKTIGASQSADIQEKYMDFDIWYSMGVTRPIALGLNSYPDAFSEVYDDNSEEYVDLATIDVIRQRERGVPRYNDFRQSVGLDRLNHYENITNKKSVIKQLEESYDSIDDMDFIIGCMVENDGGIRVPQGFIFGETMYQAMLYSFTAMIERDRFYTTAYDIETYSEYGMAWVELNGFADVIGRHYPQLRDYVNPNPFINWKLTTTLIDGSDKNCKDNSKEWYEDPVVLGLTISLIVLFVLFCVLMVVYMAQRNKRYDAVQADADY